MTNAQLSANVERADPMREQAVKFTVEVVAKVEHLNYPAQEISQENAIQVARDGIKKAIEFSSDYPELYHQYNSRIQVTVVSVK